MIIYYSILFGLSILLGVFYAFKWHKHYDVHITLIFLITPIVNLGYLILALSKNLNEALLANKITYLGGCYLLLMILYSVFSLCKVKLPLFFRMFFLIFSSLVYVFALTIGYTDYFYKHVELAFDNGAAILVNKEYGFMHVIFLIMVISYFVISLVVVAYTYFKNKQVSRKMILLLFLTEVVGIISFFGGRLIFKNLEIIPLAYVLSQILFVVIISKINLYDVTETAIDSIIEKGDTGFVSIDFKERYLGSNEKAKLIIPDLNMLSVDSKITNSNYCYMFIENINRFRHDKDYDKFYFARNDKIYLVNMSYLYDGKRKRGYHFQITDDTKNQEYIELLNKYNNDLKTEVENKTKHIVEMHDNFIIGLATMIESRDNSTGGHIKRTSEGVKLLVNEIKKNNTFNLDNEFSTNIIKAAPMHDLGKVAVDDRILRKPSKLTPEEYEEMKKHPAEGARIINDILCKSDNLDFKKIAINVAKYHHERWDGDGYPEGLKGEEIPLEARIMAIADYYDALASKRVYKDAIPPSEVNKIILNEFGTHFDPKLKEFFIKAQDKFEKYYLSIDAK